MIDSLIALAQATAQLPGAAYILATLGLGVGLIFWIMGRRLLKPAFALLGTFIGAGTGFFIAPAFGESAFGFPTPYAGLALGGLIGLCVGVLFFRFAVAITTGIALGLAGGLLSAAYLHFSPSPPDPGATQTATPRFQTPALQEAERMHQFVQSTRPVARDVRDYISQRTDELNSAWRAMPEHDQVVMGVSSLGAAFGGFFLGVFAPKRSAAVATALFGSALWLGCGAWLLTEMNAPFAGHLHQGAVVWLPAWLVLALLGFAVQVSGMGTKKKKPEEE